MHWQSVTTCFEHNRDHFVRVLLLIIQFPPDVNPTGVLMSQLSDGLVACGHEVFVVTTFPHYEKFEVWEQYRGKLAEREQLKGLDILRLIVFANGRKQRMFYRLISYLSFNILATLTLLTSWRSYDVILCPNGSFFTGLTAFIGRGLRKTPIIYNVQDLYPETFVRAGQLRNQTAIAILERLEGLMYRLATHVTVIAPAFKRNLLAKRMPPQKVSVVPNFVDAEFIQPLPRQNDFSAEHNWHEKFVVLYAGNLGYVYDLETLLQAAACLRDHTQILFVIVGDGVTKATLKAKAEALQLDNVCFMPFQPRERLPWLRASSDLQVSLYQHGAAKYSLPSKIYEIMASGRPLLASADPNSDVWNLVNETGCGLCVEPENVEQLADAIKSLYNNPAQREQMGVQGRRQAEQHFSKQAVVTQYHDLLQRVALER
jgi:colanic acid biosynthesis glycosyl transferase WcaI